MRRARWCTGHVGDECTGHIEDEYTWELTGHFEDECAQGTWEMGVCTGHLRLESELSTLFTVGLGLERQSRTAILANCRGRACEKAPI